MTCGCNREVCIRWILLLEALLFKKCTGSPTLSHTASSTDKLEHFIHVESGNEVFAKNNVRNWEVSTVTERLIGDDEGEEVGRSKFLHLVQVLWTDAFLSVNSHTAEEQFEDEVIDFFS